MLLACQGLSRDGTPDETGLANSKLSHPSRAIVTQSLLPASFTENVLLLRCGGYFWHTSSQTMLHIGRWSTKYGVRIFMVFVRMVILSQSSVRMQAAK
jgi:hypothetical protein